MEIRCNEKALLQTHFKLDSFYFLRPHERLFLLVAARSLLLLFPFVKWRALFVSALAFSSPMLFI